MKCLFVLLGVSTIVAAAPTDGSKPVYTLPMNDADRGLRTQEIQAKQAGLLYGPSLLGDTSFFPGGPLGEALVARDSKQWEADAAYVVQASLQESAVVMEDLKKNGGLKSLNDYAILYNDKWNFTNPRGIARGEFRNLTLDIHFSMKRLSINPYIIERLHPKTPLPFSVDHPIIRNLTQTTLSNLHKEGRLFVADHSYQKKYEAQQGRYSAACTAMFYIDKRSNQLLPLAIRSDPDTGLVYTPLDEPNDWLLAKIMFNSNDLFHGQMYHLANSHAVAEIVYLAAKRSMSDRHPVLVLLDRLMYQAYALRPVGEKILFNPGGSWDKSFALSNVAARQFASESWSENTGPFRRNYFESNLRNRGLIDADYGPELPDFPFYEDGTKIIKTIRAFVKTFVEATYRTEEVLAKDDEIKAWVAEANGKAQVIDFADIRCRQDLIDVLSHMAWLTGVSHHVLNEGEPFATSGVLPFQPAALYAPVPTKKGGITSLLPWLPNEQKSVDQILLVARFNRPKVIEQKKTTRYMFNDERLLSGASPVVKEANSQFIAAMGKISKEILTRKFDKRGLSQGMPILWTGMDPDGIPFYLAV